jgi:hypothetical protein
MQANICDINKEINLPNKNYQNDIRSMTSQNLVRLNNFDFNENFIKFNTVNMNRVSENIINSTTYNPIDTDKEKVSEIIKNSDYNSNIYDYISNINYQLLNSHTEDINKYELLMINFENDTSLTVININEKYLDIITKWYEKANLIFDFEKLDIKIPKIINLNKYYQELSINIETNQKEDFINSLLPKVISKIILIESINKDLDKFNKSKSEFKHISERAEINRDYKSLKDLNINIPINFLNTVNDDLCEFNNYSQYNSKVYNSTVSGLNYYDVIDYDTVNKINENKYTIILNYISLKTIIITKLSKDDKFILDNYSEYGFIKLFDILVVDNQQLSDYIITTFDNKIFDNSNEINKILDIVSTYIDLYKNSNNDEFKIKEYITCNYNIDNDINNKIKFTNLFNSITTDLEISNPNSLKNHLSQYLKNLGLNKKRFNDGYYYYGITKKEFIDKKELFIKMQNEMNERASLLLENTDIQVLFNQEMENRNHIKKIEI